MNTISTLEMLLRDYKRAVQIPWIARAVLFAPSAFKDDFTAAIVLELMTTQGDWKKAVRALPYAFAVRHKSRLAKFSAWAERVTRREVRGLLEWKGGAN